MSGSTTFYSTKRNTNVFINNDKVCGYRIKNPWMKKGFSNGVKAGRDNGVVDQKLSRFATCQESEEAGRRCAGNTNWLNHKKGQGFTAPYSSKNQFSLGNRPDLKEGVIGRYSDSPDLKPNQRNGRGNRLLERVNFTASNILPRMTFPFETLQAMTVGEAGLLTGEPKGLQYKRKVKIPDPTDFKWLQEKERREIELTAVFAGLGSPEEIQALVDNELRINPPLGRTQRMITRETNDFTTVGLSIEPTIKRLHQEVRDGRAENEAGRIQIIRDLGETMQKVDDVNALTVQARASLMDMLVRLNMPKSYKTFFGPGQPQIIGGDWLNAGQNRGLLYLYLMTNIDDDLILTLSKPLYNSYRVGRRDWKLADGKISIDLGKNFTKIINSSNANTRGYIDLYRRTLINASIAKKFIDGGASSALSANELGFINLKAAAPNLPPIYGARRLGIPANTI